MTVIPYTGYTTHATVVVYDIAPIKALLSPDARAYSEDFVHHVLHKYREHAVEGFTPTSLGPMVNVFEQQTTAIQAFYRLLGYPLTQDRFGEHLLTKFQGDHLWIIYLEHYGQGT